MGLYNCLELHLDRLSNERWEVTLLVSLAKLYPTREPKLQHNYNLKLARFIKKMFPPNRGGQ